MAKKKKRRIATMDLEEGKRVVSFAELEKRRGFFDCCCFGRTAFELQCNAGIHVFPLFLSNYSGGGLVRCQ